MNLPFLPVIREALGFASHKYDTIARLAWFPLLLVFLFSMMYPYLILTLATDQLVTVHDFPVNEAMARVQKNIAYLWQSHSLTMLTVETLRWLLVTVAYSSFLVPLMQLAARGEQATHRSLSLQFGPRQLKFVFASLLTILGVSAVTWLPLTATTHYVNQYVTEAMAIQYAVFPDESSLHTIELTNALTDRSPFDTFLKSFGAVMGIALLYFSIRMFAAPIFAAVREKSDNYNSFSAAWRLTRGWNTFWVALIAVLLAGSAWIVAVAINAYALPLMLTTLNAIWGLLRGVAGLEPGSGIASAEILAILNWIWAVIRIIANMLWLFFVTGLIAGLGGALFRQIPAKE